MRRDGATFLEITIAVFLIALVLGPMVLGFTGQVRGTDHTNRRVVAIALTNQALERFKSERFARLGTLFEKDGGAKLLRKDPAIASDLVGEAFQESTKDYVLGATFEEIVKGKQGLLIIRCEFPSGKDGRKASVSLAKVVVDWAKVGFEGEEPERGPQR